MAIDRPDDRHGPEAIRERERDGAEQGAVGQLRRASTLRPDRVADQRGQTVCDHIDRSARDDLVRALIDRGVAMDK